MAAVFRIKQVFELRSRGMLMIVGEVLTGDVRVGDHASGLARETAVASVETICRLDGSRCDIALGIRFSDDQDLVRLTRSVTIGGDLVLDSLSTA